MIWRTAVGWSAPRQCCRGASSTESIMLVSAASGRRSCVQPAWMQQNDGCCRMPRAGSCACLSPHLHSVWRAHPKQAKASTSMPLGLRDKDRTVPWVGPHAADVRGNRPGVAAPTLGGHVPARGVRLLEHSVMCTAALLWWQLSNIRATKKKKHWCRRSCSTYVG